MGKLSEQMKPCPTCHGERWVCENHADQPWNDEGCMCGAGMPCPVCNPCTREIPPVMQPGTTVIWSVTGELEDKPQ